MTTLPASLVQRLVAETLHSAAGLLRNRVERNPRRVAPSVQEGRRNTVREMERAVRDVRALSCSGQVSAEVAGLLIAWAAGYSEAIPQLEGVDARIEEVGGKDIVGACRLLLSEQKRRTPP